MPWIVHATTRPQGGQYNGHAYDKDPYRIKSTAVGRYSGTAGQPMSGTFATIKSKSLFVLFVLWTVMVLTWSLFTLQGHDVNIRSTASGNTAEAPHTRHMEAVASPQLSKATPAAELNTTVLTKAAPITTKKPLSPQKMCPKLQDIKHLNNKRSLNLLRTSTDKTEDAIFNTSKDVISKSVKEGNHLLGILQREAASNKSRLILDGLSSLETIVNNYVYLPGGHWKPAYCKARWKVAILIPYRNRSVHVPILLRYLVPMLQKQRLEFGIYIVNQGNDLAFNRAMLLNVGFVESLKFSKWDCFVLHDVDHVALSELNPYGCDQMPREFVSGADRWKYKLTYPNFFGAVTGLTTSNVRKINGFPNTYWGWGGEDEDIFQRVRAVQLNISRPKGNVGFFNVIGHNHRSAPKFKKRFDLLKTVSKDFKFDGLNNLKYTKQLMELNLLYTNISVDIWKVLPTKH